MTSSAPNSQAGPHTVAGGYLFGLPIGDLGWFATLLVSAAAGFATFFGMTFLAIIGLLIDNAVTHTTPDYAISYRLIGFPAGLLILVTSLFYLGFLWVRRITRRA